jgi:hypothetical protein
MKSVLVITLGLLGTSATAFAGDWRGHLETGDLPAWLRDRGDGVATSMFGTYIQKGQLLVYPFFEYYRDADYEYAPNELGYTDDRDFRGDYEASEHLLLVAYGFSDRFAVELEAAFIQA